MPRLPTRLVNVSGRAFGKSVTVRRADQLSDGLFRVTFGADTILGKTCRPGQEIEFRVSAREFRRYTPSRWDGESGEFDVLFARHGDGPGIRWADALRPGAPAMLLGPGGRFNWTPDGRQWLLGDSSAIGLFQRLISIRAGAGQGVTWGAVELPAGDVTAASELLPGLDVLPTNGTPGTSLQSWLASGPAQLPDHCSLIGNAQAIQTLGGTLRTRGMPSRAITIKPYWSDGKTGR